MDWNKIIQVWLEFLPFISIYLVVSQLQHGKVMERFKAVDIKFDAVNEKFDAKFDAINEKFDAKFDSVNTRFDSVNTRFDSVNTRFNLTDANLNSAVAQLEKAIADATLVHIRAEHGVHVSLPDATDTE
jgi:hypothetical protein